MYEAEINRQKLIVEKLPHDIAEKFKESADFVYARTVLPWSEHCVECVWPICYTTCSLYTPREDGNCRLFIDGMVRIENRGGLNNYALRINFKKWGKLWASGTTKCYEQKHASYAENINDIAGTLATLPALPKQARVYLAKKISYYKQQITKQQKHDPDVDAFLLECFNPNRKNVGIVVTIRASAPEKNTSVFQYGITLTNGFNRAEIPSRDINRRVDLKEPFGIDISWDQTMENVVLYFGFIDFIKKRPVIENIAGTVDAVDARTKKSVKCVVWDLDNTLWDGVLIEDGLEKVKLKDGIQEIIVELDERGILQSVASKNNPEDGLAAIKKFGIEEYFLYPQISWGTKSGSIKQLASLLNIGIDTFLFVDDQVFEREEVVSSCPEVRVWDALEYREIVNIKECNVPKTTESRKRRTMYQQEEKRNVAKQSTGDNYIEFLRSCNLKMVISRLNENNKGRVYELAQRTNQMNFSGNRYTAEQLEAIRNAPDMETMVIECGDIYGSYGIVGFSVLDKKNWALIDLMFSCRIQSKRAEHAFLSHILNTFLSQSNDGISVVYNKSPRNHASGKVFEEMGFVIIDKDGDKQVLKISKDSALPDDNIYAISMIEDH